MIASVANYRSKLTGIFLAGCLLAPDRSVADETPRPNWLDGKIISEVIPVGNHSHTSEKIRGIMRSQPGMAYDTAAIQEDIRRLHTTKWFQPESINIIPVAEKDGRVKLIVRVAELISTIEDIQFLGAQHLSQKELMTLVRLRKGEPMNPLANHFGELAILYNYQHEQGRLYASVQLIEGDQPSDKRVIYQIVEGPLVKVEDIDITCVDKSIEAQLREGVLNRRILKSRPGEVFRETNLQTDRRQLIDFCAHHKLPIAEIVQEIIQSPDLSRVMVVYHYIPAPRISQAK